MTTSTPKTPSASGISRLLATAGFARAERQGRGGTCSGFRVSTVYARKGAVRVKHLFWSMNATAEQHAVKLAPYAKAITEAGWSVEIGDYELIVTAKED